MASPPFSIAETIPGDGDIASQFPATERTYRDVVESWLLVNHDTNGKHKFIEIPDNVGDPTFAAGLFGIWQNAGFLNMRLASGTIKRVINWVPGTLMIFAQAAPPLGWSLVTGINDRVLRVNSTAGGGQGGDWTFGGVSINGHVLTVAEMPAHRHDTWVSAGAQVAPPGGATGNTLVGQTPVVDGSGVKGGDQPHSHTISNGVWRPAYTDVVIGSLS